MSAHVERALAPAAEEAMLVAILFQKLGGEFVVQPDGRRQMFVPEVGGDRMRCLDVCYSVLKGTSDPDREMIFGAFATVHIEADTLIPSIEEPKRRPYA